jgi:twitching motility protein PilI
MARRISLKEFQEHLSRRLTGAAAGQSTSSLLGVQAGKELWLIELAEAGEIVTSPPLAPVPLTRPAFVGLANIRGNLHAVTDFSRFLGNEAVTASGNARLLLIGTRFGSNVALLVTRLLGLKHLDDFEAVPNEGPGPDWLAGTVADRNGQTWRRLKVRELLADPEFMNIGI